MKFNSIAQSSLAVLSLLVTPVHSFAAEAPCCISVNGGFDNTGGTTFVARNFTLPTEYFGGGGALGMDYIQLSREAATEPFTGQDSGYFAGSAEPVSWTSDLLTLPSSHD
jgi:hypothetical protein